MNKFVDTFDLSIKALKGSTEFTTDEKVTHFETMLVQYAELFKKWITLVPEGAIVYNPRSPLSEYFSHIDKVLDKTSFVKEDLNPTSGFNVSAFAIGSAVNLHGGYPPIQPPETLEDIFTMVHQCLLATLNALNTQAGIKDIVLPELVQSIVDEILKLQIEDRKASLVSIEFVGQSIALLYNIPLRSHSMQLELQYKKNNPSAVLTIKLFGANEHERWDNIACLAKSLSGIGVLQAKVSEAVASNNGLELKLLIDNVSCTDKLWNFISNMAHYSFDIRHKYKYTEDYIAALYKNLNIIFSQNLCSKPTLFEIASRKLNESFKKITFTETDIIAHYPPIFQNTLEQIKIFFQSEKHFDITLKLLKILINKDYPKALKYAEKLAKNWTLSNKNNLHEIALDLYSTLVIKHMAFDEAMESAKKATLSKNPKLHAKALDLYTELVRKNKAIDDAIESAKIATLSKSPELHKKALELYIKLVYKAQAYDQAIHAVQVVIQSIDPIVRGYLLRLLIELMKQGKGIQEALTAVNNVIQSTDPEEQKWLQSLLIELVLRGHGIQQALTAVNNLLHSTNPSIERGNLIILKHLVPQGHGIQQALTIIDNVMQSDDRDVQVLMLELLVELVQQKHAIQKALTIVDNLLQSTDPAIQMNVIRILTYLVQQGLGIQQALTIAKIAEKSIYGEVQRSLSSLIDELKKQGHSIQ